MTAPARRQRLSFADPRVFLPFCLVALIWGSTWLVIKDQISFVPPSWTIAYRFVIATAAMLVLLTFRREKLRITKAGLPIVAIVGVTQFVMNFHFVYRAEMSLTSGIVALFFALIMIPNSILAWFVLRDRVSMGFVVGSAVAIVGVGLLLMHEYDTAGAREGVMLGTAINVALAVVLDGPPVWDPRPEYGLGLLYLGVVGSVITFPLYFTLIRNMGAGRAAYIGVATPILAMLLSTLFEGYDWTALTVGGSLLALAGLVLALKARS